jgi:protocatechuate 3,4-dioxygenase beta subunit
MLWLLAPLLLSAQTAVVEGDAVSAATGGPVAGLHVWLNDKPVLFAITDSAGHFRLADVATGSQFVNASGAGWLNHSAPINVESGRNGAGIKLRMLPEALISGKVEDESGWPVFQAQVMAVRYSLGNGWQQAGSVQTNDLGEYRLAKLPPGRYWLRVQPGSRADWDPRFTTTFYPGPPVAPDSPALSLVTGQQVSGLNIRLRKEEGRQVRGRVIWPAGIPAPAQPQTLRMQSAEPWNAYAPTRRSVSLAPDGAFVARHVAPGSYRLAVEVRDNQNLPPAQSAYRRIEVADADIDDLVLEVKPVTGQDVAGTLTVDAGAGPDTFQVDLNGGNLTAQPGSNGDFVVHGVLPGRPYQIIVRGPDGRFARHVQVRSGDALAVRGQIQLDGEPTSPLLITVLLGISLAGSVKDADNRAVPGAAVALWGGSDERYGFNITDAGGGFTIEAPLPGVYRVYTVDDAALGRLLADPEYLKAHAGDYPPVTVVQGQNPPLVLVYAAK